MNYPPPLPVSSPRMGGVRSVQSGRLQKRILPLKIFLVFFFQNFFWNFFDQIYVYINRTIKHNKNRHKNYYYTRFK